MSPETGSPPDQRLFAVEAVKSQRARTLALLEDLPHADWERTVTPGWRVREVAAHLISSDEGALTGRMLRIGLRSVEIDRIEAWNDEQVARWATRPIPALLHALDRWGRRIARVIATAPRGLKLPGPFGSVTGSWLGLMRVFDEWIHMEDVRRTMGLPGDHDPDAVRPVLRHLSEVAALQTFPSIPDGATGVVAIRSTDSDEPGVTVDLATRVPSAGLPDATIEGPAAAIIMVAAGRDPWAKALDDGVLTVEGDRAAAETFLKVFRAV